LPSIYKNTKSGFCRICNQYRTLTEDHIPPEKCFNESPVYVTKPYEMIIDKGLKIKSICAECNNKILGGNYDNELKVFVKEIDKYYRLRYAENVLFKNAVIKIDKIKVMRSILGHILSCYSTQDDLKEQVISSVDCYSNRMRAFVNGIENDFYKEIRLVFWLHPYRTIKVVPNVVMTELYNSETSLGGALFSFYPIGIFVINKNNYNLIKNLQLNEICIDNSEEQIVNMNSIQDEDFPFSLLKNNSGICFLYNSEEIIHGVKSEYFMHSKILKPGTY
jgi:hypothetical protein